MKDSATQAQRPLAFHFAYSTPIFETSNLSAINAHLAHLSHLVAVCTQSCLRQVHALACLALWHHHAQLPRVVRGWAHEKTLVPQKGSCVAVTAQKFQLCLTSNLRLKCYQCTPRSSFSLGGGVHSKLSSPSSCPCMLGSVASSCPAPPGGSRVGS